jgi:hypothetical protein
MYIKIVSGGCPVCKGDVKGNHKYRYHCENCSLLFRFPDLNKEKGIKEVITDNPRVLGRPQKGNL